MSELYYFNGFNIYCLIVVSIIYLYIAYIDFQTSCIWDTHVLLSVVINVINAVATDKLIDCIIGGIIGLVVHYLLYYVVKSIYGEEKYGMGDVLLMGSVGMMLGVSDFCQYQFMQIMITGIFGVLMLCFKGKDYSFPMGPVYVFWLFVYILAGKPDAIGWYFAKINMLLG